MVEYDRRDFSHRVEHRFFDDHFYGGLRVMLCFDDEIQITMNGVMLDGGYHSSNTMRFRPGDPRVFNRTIYKDGLVRTGGELLGHLGAWDPFHDAVFYVSEWTSNVYRLDRRTGYLDRYVGDVLPAKPPKAGDVFGYYTRQSALHHGRRTLYFSEWDG